MPIVLSVSVYSVLQFNPQLSSSVSLYPYKIEPFLRRCPLSLPLPPLGASPSRTESLSPPIVDRATLDPSETKNPRLRLSHLLCLCLLSPPLPPLGAARPTTGSLGSINKKPKMDQVQSELRLARGLIAEGDTQIMRIRATNNQYVEENERLRGILGEWSARAAKLERALEAERSSNEELRKNLSPTAQ